MNMNIQPIELAELYVIKLAISEPRSYTRELQIRSFERSYWLTHFAKKNSGPVLSSVNYLLRINLNECSFKFYITW